VLFLLAIFCVLNGLYHLASRKNARISINLRQRELVMLAYTAVGLIGMQSFLSWGATYTIMSHANLFSSLCAIMIVIARLSTCLPVSKAEIVGSIIALGGCLITTFDPSAQKTIDEHNKIQLGNFLSFCSSLFALIYILQG
jgi:hypothetical protein